MLRTTAVTDGGSGCPSCAASDRSHVHLAGRAPRDDPSARPQAHPASGRSARVQDRLAERASAGSACGTA